MTVEADASVAANLEQIHQRIDRAAHKSGRSAQDVTLVAVSKTHPQDRVKAALDAGHRIFGENRVQEAEGKYPELREAFPDLELHLIGPLQTNKAEDAVALFDVIQTLDREKLAKALVKAMDKLDRRPRCFVQVNVGEESQKAGVLPEEADAFIAACRGDYGLPLEGVMCIPPLDEAPSPYFALLRQIAERNGLAGLSMGMSGDYETAVELGATHVRVGTALFGARPPQS